jgi:drug/metabolite transporter (DMT)-like permease
MKNWFDSLPGPYRAVFWFLCAATSFILMMAVARLLAGEVHLLVMIFWRALFGVMFMLPWLMRRGISAMRSQKVGYHGLRTLINYGGLVCTFYAVTMLPLADITAISFIRPIIATLLAIAILGEASYGRRWIAIAVGLCGATIIIRPGLETLNPGVFLVLGMVLAGSFIAILARYLVQHDQPDTLAMYMVSFLTVLSLGPALVIWTTPSWEQFQYLLVIGLLGTCSQRALARAFQAADASVVVSFDYLRLPIAAVVGFAFFAEVPDMWVWAGAAVICVSSILLARSETR